MAKKLAAEISDKFAGVVNGEALKRYVDRIVRLHEDRSTLNEDIKAVYAESKSAGFDTTILREIVREFRMEEPARHSRYALLESYRRALGMLADTPLGEAALKAAEASIAPNGHDPAPRPQRPRPFAEQPLKRGRGRPRKDEGPRPPPTVDDALAKARRHLGDA